MAFDLGSVIAKVELDTAEFQKNLSKAEQGVQSFASKMEGLGQKITSIGKNVSVVSAAVGIPFTLFMKDASKEAINLERALTTLDIISGRFGVSGEEAKQAAQDLGRELRIGVGAAAEGLQNLLKSGLGLSEAKDLMKRFTNEAITGKSNSIDLATAVQNLSFAYATNNSALGNLSGINENFNDIIERGKNKLIEEGVAADTITEDMAKYRGMIELTNLTLGSSERFHGSIIDKQAQMDQALLDLKVSFGQLINPVLADLVTMLTNVVNWFNSLDDSTKKVIVVIGLIVTAIGPFLIILGMLVQGIGAVITIGTAMGTLFTFLSANPIVLIIAAIAAIILIGILLIKNWDKVMEAATTMVNWIADKWEGLKNKLNEVGGKILDAIMWPFNEAKKRIEGAVNWIKDKLDFTKRHSPSVVDIVNRGVREVNKALQGLDFNTNLTPSAALAVSNQTTTNPVVNQIRVDMSGAIITDASGAMEMGEILGDSIIKRLQQNVRF